MTERILRASSMGFPCDRHLWFSCSGYDSKFNSSTLRIFDLGNAIEPLGVKWLKEDGWEVEYNPGSQEALNEIVIPVADNCYIKGHWDCIISRKNDDGVMTILVDIKTMSSMSFHKWRGNTKLNYPQYYDQVNIYGHGYKDKLPSNFKLGIYGINKDNANSKLDIFDYDSERINGIMERANFVFSFDEKTPAPINDNKPDWACGYCSYKDACDSFEYKTMKIENTESIITILDDEELVTAVATIQEARDLGKTAETLENTAKAVLSSKLEKDKKYQISRFVVSINVSKRKAVNLEKLRKENPLIAQTYTEEKDTISYKIKENN